MAAFLKGSTTIKVTKVSARTSAKDCTTSLEKEHWRRNDADDDLAKQGANSYAAPKHSALAARDAAKKEAGQAQLDSRVEAPVAEQPASSQPAGPLDVHLHNLHLLKKKAVSHVSLELRVAGYVRFCFIFQCNSSRELASGLRLVGVDLSP